MGMAVVGLYQGGTARRHKETLATGHRYKFTGCAFMAATKATTRREEGGIKIGEAEAFSVFLERLLKPCASEGTSLVAAP